MLTSVTWYLLQRRKKMIVLVCTESYKNSYKLQLLKSKLESRARGTDLVRLRPASASGHFGQKLIGPLPTLVYEVDGLECNL